MVTYDEYEEAVRVVTKVINTGCVDIVRAGSGKMGLPEAMGTLERAKWNVRGYENHVKACEFAKQFSEDNKKVLEELAKK